jgi:hypothetical protein
MTRDCIKKLKLILFNKSIKILLNKMTFPYDSSKKYIKPGSKSSYFVDKKGDQVNDNDNVNVNRKYVKFNIEEVGTKRPRYWDASDTCDSKDKDKDKGKDESSVTSKKVPRGSDSYDDIANGGDFIAF